MEKMNKVAKAIDEEDEEQVQLPPGCVISESMATGEVTSFVNDILDDFMTEAIICKKYRRLVTAVMRGNISLTGEPLVYKLREPLNVDGEYPVIEFTLQTRMPLPEHQRIIKGLKDRTDQVEFGIKCMAYFTGQTTGIIRKLGDKDLKFLEEFCGLFT